MKSSIIAVCTAVALFALVPNLAMADTYCVYNVAAAETRCWDNVSGWYISGGGALGRVPTRGIQDYVWLSGTDVALQNPLLIPIGRSGRC